MEDQMLTMLEAAAGQENGQVLGGMRAASAQVAAEEEHRAIQERPDLLGKMHGGGIRRIVVSGREDTADAQCRGEPQKNEDPTAGQAKRW